ncbi:tRNA1(Val) (adenine(37)-N6)-methyltransferase [Cellulophaga sp. BC115SP]|uniref:tRNA1(Val) (adenine(37)-N6)-methyltransferase n=1 Tax=Cellulophaga sp. BC115SP TaxID=2683263 RepID=UPI001411EBCB|nr:methyltransferase [Cellulophaga sp. BC115SP]NBB27155.1 methyltransferase [Cellulophaga sp. BC115SP]
MFQFKQFTIHQDQCAMKVSTDACILGAWVDVAQAENILDIGSGTGLLSLMMAQRTNAAIDAIELDLPAFEQAKSNIAESKWSDRIGVFHGKVQDFSPDTKYDYIVSNPPFYQNHLKSEKVQKNQAHHTETLSFEELLDSVLRLRTTSGKFAVLLPAYEAKVLESLAINKGLLPQKKLTVRHREGAKILRVIVEYGSEPEILENTELLIKDAQDQYTGQFSALLKEYYLIF